MVNSGQAHRAGGDPGRLIVIGFIALCVIVGGALTAFAAGAFILTLADLDQLRSVEEIEVSIRGQVPAGSSVGEVIRYLQEEEMDYRILGGNEAREYLQGIGPGPRPGAEAESETTTVVTTAVGPLGKPTQGRLDIVHIAFFFNRDGRLIDLNARGIEPDHIPVP